MALERKLRRAWRWWVWQWAVPGVLDDTELCDLLQITASDLAAIRTEADARAKPGSGAYRLDGTGRRQWVLRQALPLACRTLRGFRQ